MDPMRLVWGTGDAPGPFLEEHGCCLPASQATGMRLPTALRPGRARSQEVLASRQDLRSTISCPEYSVCRHCTCSLLWLHPRGWSMHLTKVQRVLHLFKTHRSMLRSQPGRKGWKGPRSYQDTSLQKNYCQFCLVPDFLPFNFYMFSCWS